MFVFNGAPLLLDVPFTDVEGTQYPANWLRNATPEQREALGITEVLEEPSPSPEPIPFDLENHKAMCIKTVKDTTFQRLATTDWQIIRALERLFKDQMTAEEKLMCDDREAIRVENNNVCDAITAATEREEVELAYQEFIVRS